MPFKSSPNEQNAPLIQTIMQAIFCIKNKQINNQMLFAAIGAETQTGINNRNIIYGPKTGRKTCEQLRQVPVFNNNHTQQTWENQL